MNWNTAATASAFQANHAFTEKEMLHNMEAANTSFMAAWFLVYKKYGASLLCASIEELRHFVIQYAIHIFWVTL